jgi:hypothetical protein
MYLPTTPVVRRLRPLILLGLFSSLHAETVVQPTNFSTSNEGALFQGTGSQMLAHPNYFAATVAPFDRSLGTLVSFTIQCEIQGELNGSVEATADSGTASGSLGGTFLMNGIAFDGTGGANGTGGPGGAPLQATFGIPSYERTLLVSESGQTYNPALLDLVNGSEPFELLYQSAVMVNHENVQDLFASVSGTLTITYTYETATGGTATLKVVGVVRNSSTGEVTIEWTSQPEKSYRVEAGDSLEVESFETIAPAVPAGSGATTSFTEAVPATTPRRFYRVHENN